MARPARADDGHAPVATVATVGPRRNQSGNYCTAQSIAGLRRWFRCLSL